MIGLVTHRCAVVATHWPTWPGVSHWPLWRMVGGGRWILLGSREYTTAHTAVWKTSSFVTRSIPIYRPAS